MRRRELTPERRYLIRLYTIPFPFASVFARTGLAVDRTRSMPTRTLKQREARVRAYLETMGGG